MEPIKDPIEQATGKAVFEEFWKQDDLHRTDWNRLAPADQEPWVLLARVARMAHRKMMREEGRCYGPRFAELMAEHEHRSHVTHILVHAPDPADMEHHYYRWWCECGDVSLTDYPDQDAAAEAAHRHKGDPAAPTWRPSLMTMDFTEDFQRRLRAVLSSKTGRKIPESARVVIGTGASGSEDDTRGLDTWVEISSGWNEVVAYEYAEPNAWPRLLADLEAVEP